MSFQKKVNNTQALGSAGRISKAIHSYLNTFQAIAGDDKVKVGCFVQKGQKEGEVIGTSGVAVNSKVLGVVVKEHYVSSESETITFKAGDNVTILNAGNIFIEAKSEAKIGQYVHISKTDGALSFDETIDTSGSTKVYTGFRVSKGNQAPYATDGIIEITTANA